MHYTLTLHRKAKNKRKFATMTVSKHISSSTSESKSLISTLNNNRVDDDNKHIFKQNDEINNNLEEQSYLLQKERLEILTKLRSILKESMISIAKNKHGEEEYKDVNTLKIENDALHSTNKTISYSMKRLITCIEHLLSHDSMRHEHIQKEPNEKIALLDSDNDDNGNDILLKFYEIRENLISTCNQDLKIELISSHDINDLRAENQLLRTKNKKLNCNIGELIDSLDELSLQQNELLIQSNHTRNIEIEKMQVKHEMKLNLNDIKEAINTTSSNLYPSNDLNIIQLENNSLRYTNDKLMHSINNLINSAEELLTSSVSSNRFFFRRLNRQKEREKVKMLETLRNMRESLNSSSCAFDVVDRHEMDLIASENELLKDVNDRLAHTIKHLVACVEQLMQN